MRFPVQKIDSQGALALSKRWLEALLGFFYPEVCQHCGAERATAAQGYIGAQCRAHVHTIQAPICDRCGLPSEGAISSPYECSNCREMELHFSYARAAIAAKGLALDLIHQYKYRRRRFLEPYLAELFLEAAVPDLAPQWRRPDWVVPVPLHPMKAREREFNQAERLASHLGRALDLPVQSCVLQRAAPTRTQTQLTRQQRTENVRKAFALNQTEGIRGRRLVLVDDVLTTGATTSACARLLRRAGARDVCVWTLARGLLH